MAVKKSIKKYTGVYYSESKVKKWRERPDRCYWFCFRDAQNGKLRWERCGWSSEGWTPEAAQRRRYELLEQDRTGGYKPKQERKLDKLTLAGLSDQYLRWAQANKKASAADESRYRNHLAPVFGDKTLKEISPLHIEKLKRDLQKKGLSPKTIHHCLNLLRGMYRKAAAWGLYAGEIPTSKVDFPKLNNKRLRFLTHEEAARLLDELAGRSQQTHDQALLALHCGMRFGEIAALVWGDLDFRNGVIHIRDSKAGESQQVYMNDEVKTMLLDRMEDDPNPSALIFPGRKGQRQAEVSDTFERTVNDLGLNNGVSNTAYRVVFHTLRHTFASWLAMQGTPLFTIKELMRHKTIQMTERYAHLIPDQKQEAVRAMAHDFSEARAKRKNRATSLAEARQKTLP